MLSWANAMLISRLLIATKNLSTSFGKIAINSNMPLLSPEEAEGEAVN